jgi:hypothetical protein
MAQKNHATNSGKRRGIDDMLDIHGMKDSRTTQLKDGIEL